MVNPETRVLRLLLVILALTLVVGIAVWFMNNFERVTVTRDSGYSDAAKRNPLLALERLFQELGTPTTSRTDTDLWRHPPPGDSTVLMYHFNSPKGTTEQWRIRRWVSNGGRLVIPASDDFDHPSALFKQFDIHLAHGKRGPCKDAEMALPDHNPVLELELGANAYLEGPHTHGTVLARNSCGPVAISYRQGEGEVVVLASTRFLDNYRLQKSDNALVAVHLAALGERRSVSLIYRVELPKLWLLLWQSAPQLVLGVALMLLLLLWYSGRRAGPALPASAQQRRNLAEHLRASGAFLWRHEHCRGLFQGNQKRLEQALLDRHLVLRAMDPEQRSAWVGERCGLPAAAVHQALYGSYRNEQEFIVVSTHQQIIHSNL